MIFNFGSINIDHVYRVPHMPEPGETLPVRSYERFLGGKGANQSIAIAKAGGDVCHIGAVGPDGKWALEKLNEAGVKTDHVVEVDDATGHAIIMVDSAGENQILICGGANRRLTSEQISQNLSRANAAIDWVLLQNETNLTEEIVKLAKESGLRTAYSAAPFIAEDTVPLLSQIDLLAVNEIEARALAGALSVDFTALPVGQVLVTRGAEGASLYSEGVEFNQRAFPVNPVDTTGAGDAFLGSFLAQYCDGSSPHYALRYAAAASAVQVTQPGAAHAMPSRADVEAFLSEQTS